MDLLLSYDSRCYVVLFFFNLFVYGNRIDYDNRDSHEGGSSAVYNLVWGSELKSMIIVILYECG